MTGYEQDCLRVVAKWLNEKPSTPAPTEAIATLCAVVQVADAYCDAGWLGALLTSTARRKWEELRAEGAKFVRKSYTFDHPEKGPGQIDDFGKVTWLQPSSNDQHQPGSGSGQSPL